jgi:carbon storage regulator CsrA
MLVLTRKQQEQIHIGNNIVITILKTKGKTVRLGIQAPAEVPVLRGELANSFAEQSAESAAEAPAGDTQVTQARVKRGEVSRVLPALLAGENPLRQYLNARTELVG